MMSLETLEKQSMHMHHQEDGWPHGDIVVHQQPITHHCPPPNITDEVRYSIINFISHRPGIWDSVREKTSGASRKELFAEVTREVNMQHGATLDQQLQPEDVEKQWKNLKDTFIKTRKKVSYNSDGSPNLPKWKFYGALNFLEQLNRKRRYEEEDLLPPNLIQMKRLREDDAPEDDDEYMGFCRSLQYDLREIGSRDRIQWVKLKRAISDLINETHMNVLMNGGLR